MCLLWNDIIAPASFGCFAILMYDEMLLAVLSRLRGGILYLYMYYSRRKDLYFSVFWLHNARDKSLSSVLLIQLQGAAQYK